MPKLVIGNFGGEVPRITDRMLRDNEAQLANNVRLYAGELQTWKGPVKVLEPALSGVRTIYRLTNNNLAESAWLIWDKDVNVVRSPSADLTELRIYYTGDGPPKKTNWDLATGGYATDNPDDWLYMGVPAPQTAPIVDVNPVGSAQAEDSRYYVYTYVSEFGSLEEESAPSPPSELVTISYGESVDISGFDPPPIDHYNITKIRVYRTLAGQETAGVYAFVTEIDVNNLPVTYNDDLGPDELGEPLRTIGWNAPPAGLQGLVGMSNGMLAGFEGNTVYFSEPYFPHAWPMAYAQAVPDTIVGLGVFGHTLVVMTEGHPYLMTGVSPETITVEKLPIPEPCVSARSIAFDEFGVLYASPNGLVAVGPGTAQVITKHLFRRNEWQEYNPALLIGTIYDGKYFGAFQSAVHGARVMMISRDDHPALSFLDVNAGALFTDIETSELFYYEASDGIIFQWDADPLHPVIYEWKSKRFQLPKAISWSVLKLNIDVQQQDRTELYQQLVAQLRQENNDLFATYDDLEGEINGSEVHAHLINGDILHEVPSFGEILTATVVLFGERGKEEARFNINSLDPVRIPPFKSREIEVQINGTLSVQSLVLATTVAELHRP